MQHLFIFLSEPLARFLILPIIVVAVGTFVKYTSQNDVHASFSRDLLYWGPDLCVSGLLAIIVDFSSNLGKLPPNVINEYHSKIILLVLLCGVVLFLVSLIIRKFGWKRSEIGWHYSWAGGIIIPDVLGFTLLFAIYKIIA